MSSYTIYQILCDVVKKAYPIDFIKSQDIY